MARDPIRVGVVVVGVGFSLAAFAPTLNAGDRGKYSAIFANVGFDTDAVGKFKGKSTETTAKYVCTFKNLDKRRAYFLTFDGLRRAVVVADSRGKARLKYTTDS